MFLGHKKQLLNKFVGNKNYSGSHLGHKMYDKGSRLPLLQNTPEINNDANHSHSIYEPIKGIQIKTDKSNKYLVEKKYKKNDFSPQTYV